MNKTTFQKIQDNAGLIHKIFETGNYTNAALFDEPYLLALEVLTYQHLDDKALAAKIGVSWHTIKQVRSALGIN